MNDDADPKNPFKTLLGALVLAILGAWLSLGAFDLKPLDELHLIRDSAKATGVLVDTFEFENEDARGNVNYTYGGVYRFVVGGDTFLAHSSAPRDGDSLRETYLVEYLRGNPEVNRVAGTGSRSFPEFLLRRLAILFLCLIPSINMFYKALIGFRRVAKTTVKA